MCGAPGAGKSTWLAEHAEPGAAVISRDKIRFETVREDEYYFAKEAVVFNLFCHEIAVALENAAVTDVYADATHLTEASRKKLINGVRRYTNLDDVNLCCVIVMPPLETCLAQNALREGRERVPDSVVKKMYESFQDPHKDEIGFNFFRYQLK